MPEETPVLNEALQKVSKWLIDCVEEGQRSLKDGWQKSDFFNFLDEGAAAPGAIKRFPEAAKLILKGLPDEQRALWIQFIKDEYDSDNDAAEAKIESIIVFVNDADRFIRSILDKPDPPIV